MSSYFQSKKSSELEELKNELNSLKQDERKEAVKQVIAMMTIGKDVSMLFPHVIKWIKSASIELKKLVYLYIINYAKIKPDLTLMAVNAFTQDAHEKSNPLIRALAVRTMGWIRIEKIAQYLWESLKDCLIDDDPYVKKTAALSVAKIYQIMPSHTKEFGFIKLLQGLLQDGNAIVVANAAAALYEISREAGKNYIKANKETIGKLLNALNETNEWGQVYILESIINYKPKDQKEAEEIIERIMPRLQHANPAVVLGAAKNILHFLESVMESDGKTVLLKKLGAPLITLLSAEPEIQYVGLWSILLILQKTPNIFDKNIKMFFVRHNEPIYVKLKKIDVLVMVSDSSNVDLIISELKEYCNDIDQDFVRKAVRAIGQVWWKIERIAKKGVEVLKEYINHEGGAETALQEAVIVACKIFRKYPKKFEALIKDICSQIKRIDEPESKSAVIWIIGEYAEKIENAQELLQFFIDSFSDESANVCLQILTAAVKMYIKMPDECEDMVMKVLHLASEASDNFDLRDRGYIYWKMLSTDPSATKDVVLVKRPEFLEAVEQLLDEESREIFSDSGIVKKKKEETVKNEIEEIKGDDEAPEEEAEPEEPEIEEKVEKKKPKKDKSKKKSSKSKKKESDEEENDEVKDSTSNEKPADSIIPDLLDLDF